MKKVNPFKEYKAFLWQKLPQKYCFGYIITEVICFVQVSITKGELKNEKLIVD
jgi:hypothetical protein